MALMEGAVNEKIRTLLRNAVTIAVVGISNKPERASHDVASFLQARGYRVIPINPKLEEVLGERCYPSLAVYGKAVDIVDVFRRSESVAPIAGEAVSTGAKALWMQEGVSNDVAAGIASGGGLMVVQDTCIKKVLMRMGAG